MGEDGAENQMKRLYLYVETLANGALVVGHSDERGAEYPIATTVRNGFLTQALAERHATRLVRSLFRDQKPTK